MDKRIMLIGIGIIGCVFTFIQIHTLGFYVDYVYNLIGLHTQALEISASYDSPLIKYSDMVVERSVVYRKKQFSSPLEQSKKEVRVLATAYTSHPLETDSTPFVTASGSTVRDGIVASNFLPMGTKFKLPVLYGDKVFVVEDRMNERYNDTKIIDIWFESRPDALQFGKRSVVLELL